MRHENTVYDIGGIHIKAEPEHRSALQTKLEAVYGASKSVEGGFIVHTKIGSITVQSSEMLADNLGPLPEAVLKDRQAAIVAIDFNVRDLNKLHGFIQRAATSHSIRENLITLTEATLFGNTIFRFSEKTIP